MLHTSPHALTLVSYLPIPSLSSIQIFNRNFGINKQTNSATFRKIQHTPNDSRGKEREREGNSERERTIGTISNYIKLSAHTHDADDWRRRVTGSGCTRQAGKTFTWCVQNFCCDNCPTLMTIDGNTEGTESNVNQNDGNISLIPAIVTT